MNNLSDYHTKPMHARYYSVRRLAPFQGALQVVDLAASRAFTANGDAWKLELLIEQPVRGPMWGSMEPVSPGRRYFSYGLWTASGGIKRVPVNALLGDQSKHPGLAPLEACLQQLPSLPFPPADHWERWLLDRRGQPLALLNSRVEAPNESAGAIHWHAMHRSDHSFQPRHPQQLDGPGASPERARLALEQGVMKFAGASPRARWFDREQQQTRNFPLLTLRERWPDPDFNQLAGDYLRWLSPWLLTLSHLPPERRAELEQFAVHRAEVLYEVRRLIPQVINRPAFDAALVEAVLRSRLSK